ncbi:MAG: hypothetical protein COA42_08995 [Alteromonadaceae bacterium]|nr:MAG: hypothetical protein COA42_08995 [Alteromonadaceae bacterium]
MINPHFKPITLLARRLKAAQTFKFATFIALTILSISACQGERSGSINQEGQVRVEGQNGNDETLASVTLALVANNVFCQASDAGMRQLHNMQDVQAALPKQVSKHYNFHKYQYILTSAGRKSTLGYRFDITAKQANIDPKTQSINLPLVLISPPKGSMVAQMISQPCAIIEISKSNAKLLHFAPWQVTLTD